MFGKIEPLQADDIAELTSMIINSPRRVAVNEIVVRPTEQA